MHCHYGTNNRAPWWTFTDLQLNKGKTSETEASSLDLNIKVIGSNIHKSVYDKRDNFEFPIVYFTWLCGDVPILPSYGIYISQLDRFARYCTSVLKFHFKNFQFQIETSNKMYIPFLIGLN